MVLYSADISNIAKPVKSVKNTKEPKIKSEPEAVQEPLEKALVEKPKKSRKRKVAPTVEVPVEQVELSVPKKKYVAKKPKISVPDVPAESLSAETVVGVEEPEQAESKKRKRTKKIVNDIVKVTPPPSPKKKKVFRDPTVPPLWFEKYIQGVKKEEAMAKEKKVPAKLVKQEATDTAQKSWDDGLTRDRVTNEVDNHMNRMYCNLLFNSSYDFCQTLIVCFLNK